MTINQSTAREALAWLRTYGTPEHAAHQVTVQLTAIQPYTDGQLVTVRTVLRRIADKPCRRLQLEAFADGQPERVEAYGRPDGSIHFRQRAV
jgi:hypothetical protein